MRKTVQDTPYLLVQWDRELNKDISPQKTTVCSHKKVWWKCDKGHSYQSAVSKRSAGRGCPYCSGHKVLQGFNDLATTHPDITSLWSDRNTQFSPQEVSAGSKKKAWWVCDKGHEWESSVKNIVKGQRCPYCSGRKVLPGFNDIKTTHPDIASEWDYIKNTHIFPSEVSAGCRKDAWWRCDRGHVYKSRVQSRTKQNSRCPYCINRKTWDHNLSVYDIYPELIHQWFEKKNKLLLEDIPWDSTQPLWWVCDKGHSYQMSIADKSQGRQCYKCEKEEEKIENNILHTHPDIAKLWDYEKNYPITPENVSSGSRKMVWWKCDLGHSWKKFIYNATKGQGCPYCSGRRVLSGFNDLKTTHPDVAKLWNYEKNGELTPQDITYGSGKKVWWICDKGHEYQSTVLNKTRKGRGECPYCIGRKVLTGYNDLAHLFPELLQQWDNDKNKGINPETLRPGSNRKVWWVCDRGHSFKQDIVSRTTNKSGCPYCSGHKVLQGFNDLATTHPDLAQQWNCEKNGNLTPYQVSCNSHRNIWWICDIGHTWVSNVYSRKIGNGCPECSKRCIVSSVEDDIANYISSILDNDTAIIRSDRTVIYPKELDIYIPDHNLAIEFNGLYWHTEEKKRDKNYHYNKWKDCKSAGIQLITIWEDEWKDKQDIVRSMLAHKLGVSRDKRVYARKTTVRVISIQESKEFLNKYHIQGFSSGSIYIGLEDDKGELIAVSSWKKNKDILYLDRYATSCTVVGGMGKLLKAGKKFCQENNISRIVTFSDHQVSNGSLYEKLGFEKDFSLYPDYKYVVKGERKHKFGYRLKKFKQDPQLIYKEGLTEKELAKLNGLERVWDCGKTRWVMEV